MLTLFATGIERACADKGWFKGKGWKYFCRFFFVVLLYNTNLMNKLKFKDFKKIINCTKYFQSTKSPHILLRGKVGQLIKRKRVLCWSIYFISLCWKVSPGMRSVTCVSVEIQVFILEKSHKKNFIKKSGCLKVL